MRKDELQTGLDRVRARIAAAEKAAGRAPGSVQLLPVSKFHPASDIRLLAELGITDFGENREQEARAKAGELPDLSFHMIGQIQSKKTNAIARWAACVHSVDSVRVAERLDRGVQRAIDNGDRPPGALPIYVQWSTDGDTSRGGALEADLPAIADAVSRAENLNLQGLMCVAPKGVDPAPAFEKARELAGGSRLSAGMSGDLEEAVAAGSDVVRVGTEIFGKRPIA